MPHPPLEDTLSDLEQSPSQGKLDACKKQLRVEMDLKQISTQAYSEMLMRLRLVKEGLAEQQ